MKKIAVLLLTALLALAAGAATAEKEKPAALPSAGRVAGAGERPGAFGRRYSENRGSHLYRGGAGRFVFTDSAAIAEIHALCCALSLGAETNIGVADDGLTLAFVTAEGETALRFEGRYAVVGEKRYETEQLGALKKDLRERIQSEIFASE